jgi:hypothetical protein
MAGSTSPPQQAVQLSALCLTSQPPTHDGPTQRFRLVGATHGLGSTRSSLYWLKVAPPMSAAVRGHNRTGYLVGVGVRRLGLGLRLRFGHQI